MIETITIAAFGLRDFTFSDPFTTSPSGPDPVFEVSVNGTTWSPPDALVGSTPTTMAVSYPFPFWGASMFRVLTQPTLMSWAPRILVVPTSGPMPFP